MTHICNLIQLTDAHESITLSKRSDIKDKITIHVRNAANSEFGTELTLSLGDACALRENLYKLMVLPWPEAAPEDAAIERVVKSHDEQFPAPRKPSSVPNPGCSRQLGDWTTRSVSEEIMNRA